MAPSLSKLAFSEPEASVSQDETSTMSKQQQLKNKGGTADDSRLLVSPLEIIQMICSKLDDPRHLLSFGRTCRAAWLAVGQDMLFEVDGKSLGHPYRSVTAMSHPSIFSWAIRNSGFDVINRVMDAYTRSNSSILERGWMQRKEVNGVMEYVLPVSWAVSYGRLEVLKYLIPATNFDINLPRNDLYTTRNPHIPSLRTRHSSLFGIACAGGHDAISTYLIDEGLYIECDHLADAIHYNRAHVVRYLLRQSFFRGPERISRIKTSISRLARKGTIYCCHIDDAMQALIDEAGPDVTGNDMIMKRVRWCVANLKGPHSQCICRQGPCIASRSNQ